MTLTDHWSGRRTVTDTGEVLAELGTRQDVDDEVDCGVEDGQHVADGGVVVVPLAALGSQRLVQNRPEYVIDERRRLTDDKRKYFVVELAA